MSFDISTINSTLGNIVDQQNDRLGQLSSNLNPDNTADLLKFQAETNRFSVVVGLQSAAIKTIDDAARGIVQKI